MAPSHHVERLDEHTAPIQPTYQSLHGSVYLRQWQAQIARDDQIDAAVKGRALPDDGKLDAKDAGEQARPRTTSIATFVATVAREPSRSLFHHGLL